MTYNDSGRVSKAAVVVEDATIQVLKIPVAIMPRAAGAKRRGAAAAHAAGGPGEGCIHRHLARAAQGAPCLGKGAKTGGSI